MSEFFPGDVVQFGVRGKTQYEVFRAGADTVDVQSKTSGQNKYEVENDRLVLVQGGPARFEAVAAEVRKAVAKKVDETLPDKNDHRQTSYGRSILFALNTLGKHVFAGKEAKKVSRKRRKVAKNARRNARRANTARFLEMTNAGDDQ